MNRFCLCFRRGFALGLLLLSPGAMAQADNGGRTLDAMDIVTLEGDRVQITLSLSETPPEPVIFTVDKPARLSLDLAATKLALPERFKRVNAGKVRSVASAEAQGRTRIVVEMLELVPYNVRTDGNRLIVEIQGGLTPALQAPVGGPVAARSQILSVDFRRGELGEGRVVMKLADPRTAVDVREEGGRVIAQFRNVDAADDLLKRLDVVDFATPVRFIDTIRDGRNINVILTPVARAEFEHVAYQAQDVFTLELQPLTPAEREERARREQIFTGERISLSFQNIEVRSLLQIIGDVSGNNVVISDGVSGTLAMRLQNVPWDQALDIILKTKGLGMQQQGNVMLIAPLAEIAARAKAEGEADKQKDEGAPLRSEIIQVNYAKASAMAALLKTGDSSLLSARGRVSVDERTNTLLVLETRERLANIRNLVTSLDIPVKQVLIESRIVIANDDYSRSLGARFGVNAFTTRIGGNAITATTGTANTNRELLDSLLDGDLTYPGVFNVNLPVAGAAGQAGLSILGPNYLVDLELSALQAEGRGEVQSTPRVITANAKQASIRQGVEIPYLEASASGAATVSFKEAVLELNVTPQITPDDRIIMDLQVKNDSRGVDVSSGIGGTIPSIDKREVNTQVLVRNGETVVLGGIYQQTQSTSVTKVPFLGDLPLLGVFFRTNNTNNNRRELLIFVTPKIVNEGLRVN